MATKCWFECPECREENNFDWDTFSFAGNFTFSAKCKCGVESVIYVDVSAQPLRAADAATPCPYCKRVHDSSLACPEYAATTPRQ